LPTRLAVAWRIVSRLWGPPDAMYCLVTTSGGYLAQVYRHESRTKDIQVEVWKGGGKRPVGRNEEVIRRKEGRDRGDYVSPGRVIFHRRPTHVSAASYWTAAGYRTLACGRHNILGKSAAKQGGPHDSVQLSRTNPLARCHAQHRLFAVAGGLQETLHGQAAPAAPSRQSSIMIELPVIDVRTLLRAVQL